MFVLPGSMKPVLSSAFQPLSNLTPFVSLAKFLVPGSIMLISMLAFIPHVSPIPSFPPIVYRASSLLLNSPPISPHLYLLIGALLPAPYLALSLGFSLFSASSSLLRVAWSQGNVTVIGLFFSFSFPLGHLGLLGLSSLTCPFSLFDFFCSRSASWHSFPFSTFSSLTPSIFPICIWTHINMRRAMP